VTGGDIAVHGTREPAVAKRRNGPSEPELSSESWRPSLHETPTPSCHQGPALAAGQLLTPPLRRRTYSEITYAMYVLSSITASDDDFKVTLVVFAWKVSDSQRAGIRPSLLVKHEQFL
jgi:hypothetical protein